MSLNIHVECMKSPFSLYARALNFRRKFSVEFEIEFHSWNRKLYSSESVDNNGLNVLYFYYTRTCVRSWHHFMNNRKQRENQCCWVLHSFNNMLKGLRYEFILTQNEATAKKVHMKNMKNILASLWFLFWIIHDDKWYIQRQPTLSIQHTRFHWRMLISRLAKTTKYSNDDEKGETKC